MTTANTVTDMAEVIWNALPLKRVNGTIPEQDHLACIAAVRDVLATLEADHEHFYGQKSGMGGNE